MKMNEQREFQNEKTTSTCNWYLLQAETRQIDTYRWMEKLIRSGGCFRPSLLKLPSSMLYWAARWGYARSSEIQCKLTLTITTITASLLLKSFYLFSLPYIPSTSTRAFFLPQQQTTNNSQQQQQQPQQKISPPLFRPLPAPPPLPF